MEVNSALSEELDDPLPNAKGPKLNRFHDYNAPIKFIRKISRDEETSHSYVFEVIINSGKYALKLVSNS